VRIGLIAVLISRAALAQGGPAEEAPSFVNEGTVNAPVAEVWKIWTSGDGYKAVGVALADVDFRVGGLIRSRYSADGVLGDEGTIENRIIAYEPQHMIAIRIERPPRSFPFHEAWKYTWTVVTLTDAGSGRTHLRVASMGFGSDPESIAMKEFFIKGNQETLDKLAKHFESGPKRSGQ
jgi:uncharacterized protein YndB with AHSA1/START domain